MRNICLLFSQQDVLQMKQRLPTELQKHLKKKLFNLLSYYQPEWGKPLSRNYYYKLHTVIFPQTLWLGKEDGVRAVPLYSIRGENNNGNSSKTGFFCFREWKRGSQVCETVEAARTAGERAWQGRESGWEESREQHPAAEPNSLLPLCESMESGVRLTFGVSLSYPRRF